MIQASQAAFHGSDPSDRAQPSKKNCLPQWQTLPRSLLSAWLIVSSIGP